MNDPMPTEPSPASQRPLESQSSGDASAADVPILIPDSKPEYEFNPGQDQVIDELARALLWVRAPLMIVAIFQFAMALALAFRLEQDSAHFLGVFGSIVTGIICLALARWMGRAAIAFSEVTQTSGRDITNLMVGLSNLAMGFDLLAFFVKIYVFLLGVLLLAYLVGLVSGSFR